MHLLPISDRLLRDFGLFMFFTMNSFSHRHKLHVACPVLYGWHFAIISHLIFEGSSERLNHISSTKEIFMNAKAEYDKALKASGYKDKIKYNLNESRGNQST